MGETQSPPVWGRDNGGDAGGAARRAHVRGAWEVVARGAPGGGRGQLARLRGKELQAEEAALGKPPAGDCS